MNYDIELNANDSSVLETQYAFTQGDYGQIQFSIRVKANGTYITNAQRAYIVFTLPNGYVVTGADMSKSVATYTYPFQGSELQVPGTILADVKLVYTDGQISSNKFSFICRYDPLHDKSFEAGPYISQLQQIVDDGQAKIDYLQSLIEILQTDVGGTPVMRSDLHNTRDAVTSGLKAIDANMAQNILLKSDVTHQNENDANKIVAADSLYTAKADLQGQITALNSNFTWKTLGSIDLLVAENIYSISYAGISINELLISYGTKNGTQTFGGGTVIFNPSESKPCFLPIYNSSNNFISSIYIFNDPSQQSLTVSRGSASADFRVNVFYR